MHKYSQGIKDRSFVIDYWDGTREKYGKGDPRFRLVFNKKIPKVKILRDPSLTFGEAYMNGTVDLEGDLQEVIETIFNSKSSFLKQKSLYRLQNLFSIDHIPASLTKQQKDIQYHYDKGNDFYRLWLDETMSYSCAYFCSSEDLIKLNCKKMIIS